MRSLSPWNNGAPDQSNDGHTPAELDSDRFKFASWLDRYTRHEQYEQHSRDYVPMAVPSSIGAAIDEQRRYDAQQLATRAQDAEAERERRRQKAEEDAREAAAQQDMQRREAERRAADQAEAEREGAAIDCRMRRQEAAFAAAKQPNANETQAYQRTGDSFHCD